MIHFETSAERGLKEIGLQILGLKLPYSGKGIYDDANKIRKYDYNFHPRSNQRKTCDQFI